MSYKELQEVYLGDIAEEITVGFVGSMTSEYKDWGIPFLRSLNVKQYKVNLNSVKFVNREFHQKLKKSALKPGDVVIVRTGKPGTATVIPDWLEEANCSDLVIVRPGNNLDSNFLAAYINTIATSHIDAHIVGAVQQHFNVASAKKMKLKLPPIEIQRKIGKTISNLNDKIEVNEKIVNLLEQISNELFKSWFIDFEFPNEQGEPYKSSGGEMVESELGEIPKGWECLALYDLADYINGASFKNNEIGNVADGLPIIKIAELKNGFSNNTKYFVGEKDKKYYLENGDILFSWSGNPYTSIDTFFWTKGQGVLNQHIFKVVSDKYPQQLIYTLLKYFKPEFSRIASNKQTTGLGHVTVKDLKNLKITLPKNTVQMKKLIALVDLILELNLENHKLVDIRDTLLPKLLSGEVEIPDELVVD
ncbi:type I restriction endonuclease subunit S [Bacillus cereus]|nr:type I restriction endonuclease subunit S [Bacillus cereus]